jgi:hypothetical protein
MDTLAQRLADPSVTIDALGAWLDSLDHAGRVAALGDIVPSQQRQIWSLSAQAVPLALTDFVPSSVGDVTEVIHVGRNTMPPGLRAFEKRFARPAGDGARLFGFNEGATRWLLGPGAFVARSTAGDAKEEALGSIVVDYYLTPDGPVPAHWPAMTPASRGISFFVFGYTRDYMRRVSQHVTIGRGYKWGMDTGALFILIRQDA